MYESPYEFSYYLINDVLLEYISEGKYWYIRLSHNNKKVNLYKIDMDNNIHILFYYIIKICYNILKEIDRVRNTYLYNDFNFINSSMYKISFNYFKLYVNNNTLGLDESDIYYSICTGDWYSNYVPKNNVTSYIINSIDTLEENIKNHVRNFK